MGVRCIRRNYSERYLRKHGLIRKVYSIPDVGDVIVVNEHPMRWADPYIKCEENNPLLMASSERFVARVVRKTSCFTIVEIPLAGGVRERSLRNVDISLAFYKYAVVESECFSMGWSYDELDLNGDTVLDNIVRVQELLEEVNLF